MVHLTKEERERAKDISYKAMIKLYPHLRVLTQQELNIKKAQEHTELLKRHNII